MAYIAFDTRVARLSHGHRLNRLFYVAGGAATGVLLMACGLWISEGIVANAIQGLTRVLGSA